MTEEETVTVPRWALQYVLDNALFWDEGEPSGGFRSRKMERAKNALDEAMEKAAK
jgi:hypothetical protein